MSQHPPIRIVFMGSPDFALPSLKMLAEDYHVVGVVTQPDRPSGRGQVLTPPAVKQMAEGLGIPVIQPARLSEPDAVETLIAWAPDLIVVAAFGQILRPAILEMPRYGCVNVHASLLPRWRGAAPIQAAILAGDTHTGVTIMRMDAGVDTGGILSQKEFAILPADTTATLSKRLAMFGAQLLIGTLPAYLSGELIPQPQPAEGVTYAPMLTKVAGQLDFTQPADYLVRQVNALNPWPGAYTTWNHLIMKIHRAHAAEANEGNPGQTRIFNGMPAIITGFGVLVLDEVQPAGKKAMPGKVFLQGARGWGG
jgi:methionyl-tRNA formyltransferase